jgi:phosphonate transport system permease protein
VSREQTVRALWRQRPRSRFARASLWALVALGVGSWFLGDFDVAGLFSERKMANLKRFLGEVVPKPLRGRAWDGDVFLEWFGGIFSAKAGPAAVTTLAISVAAIVLSGLCAWVLAFPAARTFAVPEPFLPGGRAPTALARWGWRAVRGGTRFLLVALRAIPEYVWAFLLLGVFGPSAWPAVLALAIHNLGILGRLQGETVENLPPAPLRALRAAGASRRQVALWAAVPASFSRFLLYFFYRWETCVREATVLGMLGIVSLGYYVKFDARPRGRYDEMLLFILVGSALVLVGDAVSAAARGIVRRAR